MRISSFLLLTLLVSFVVLANTKKNKNRKKKDRKQPPSWKPDSMPSDKVLFETVTGGTNFTLDCKAHGRPKPTVLWYHNGMEILSDHRKEMKKGGSLKIRNIGLEDSGNYTCKVSNKFGQLEWTFNVDVHVKLWPLIVEGPNNITQMVGSNVAFRCSVMNDPSANIRWQKVLPGNKYKPAEFLDHGEDPTVLTLENIQKTDEAEYRCMAGNVHGIKQSNAWLHVIEPVVMVPDVNAVNGDSFGDNSDAGSVDDANYQYLPDNVDDKDKADLPGSYDLPEGGNKEVWDFDNFYTTTVRPRNRNRGNRKNKDKKKKKKNRKNSDSSKKRKDRTDKDKSPVYEFPIEFDNSDSLERGKDRNDEENLPAWNIPPTTSTSKPATKTPTQIVDEENDDTVERQTVIWSYSDKGTDSEGPPDGRANKGKKRPKEGDTGKAKQDDAVKGSISSWTIYTIVGAVGGVVLLIGLVAITLALCCNKGEEEDAYKSTPV